MVDRQNLASSFSDRRAVKDGSRGLQPTVADWKNIVSHRDTGTRWMAFAHDPC